MSGNEAEIRPVIPQSLSSSFTEGVSSLFLLVQECKMELNDEEGHRCYPLNGHLLCHSCHLKNIEQGCSSSVAAASYWRSCKWRETPGGCVGELPTSAWAEVDTNNSCCRGLINVSNHDCVLMGINEVSIMPEEVLTEQWSINTPKPYFEWSEALCYAGCILTWQNWCRYDFFQF